MFNETSEFGVIDLLGSVAVNYGASMVAAKNPSIRVGIKKANGDVHAYGDYRFLGGLVAAAAGQYLQDPMYQRIAHDTASGLLNSFVATESVRTAIEKGTVCAPAQIPAGEAAEAVSGAQMGAYAW